MLDALNFYLSNFFGEVNFPAFLTCAVAFAVIAGFWGVFFLVESSGYMSKFIHGVHKTNCFLNKHLIITDYNVDEFFEKCIKKMPSSYVQGWKTYFSKRDGNTATHFQKASEKRTVDYSNSATVIAYRLVSFFAGIIAVGISFYYGMSALNCAIIGIAFVSLYIFLSSILRLKLYICELKFNRKNDEFIHLIDNFAKFKSQIVPLAHKLNNEKTASVSAYAPIEVKPLGSMQNITANGSATKATI